MVYAAHTWNAGEVTTPATHTTAGVKTFTCSDCGETKTEAIAKTTTHTHGAWAKYNSVEHKTVCACGDVIYAAHTWNTGEVTTPATHLAVGVKTFTCTDCGATKTEEIARIAEHTYGNWTTVTEATEDSVGLQEKTCACGEKITEVIPKLPKSDGTATDGNAPDENAPSGENSPNEGMTEEELDELGTCEDRLWKYVTEGK